jgi:hypothetical protein
METLVASFHVSVSTQARARWGQSGIQCSRPKTNPLVRSEVPCVPFIRSPYPPIWFTMTIFLTVARSSRAISMASPISSSSKRCDISWWPSSGT